MCIRDRNIAITPSGHGYETLTPEDVVIINRDGEVVEGKHIPSSELKVHTAIYNAYPEAGAVIHTHSIYASALAAMHQGDVYKRQVLTMPAVASLPLPSTISSAAKSAGTSLPT